MAEIPQAEIPQISSTRKKFGVSVQLRATKGLAVAQQQALPAARAAGSKFVTAGTSSRENKHGLTPYTTTHQLNWLSKQ